MVLLNKETKNKWTLSLEIKYKQNLPIVIIFLFDPAMKDDKWFLSVTLIKCKL